MHVPAEGFLVGSIGQQCLTDREAHDKQAADWTRRFGTGLKLGLAIKCQMLSAVVVALAVLRGCANVQLKNCAILRCTVFISLPVG